jgi:hypothetical protein
MLLNEGPSATALRLLLLASAVLSLNVSYEALNSSCLNASYLVSNSTPMQLAIPTYSELSIQVDLRHLQSAADLIGVTLILNLTDTDSG